MSTKISKGAMFRVSLTVNDELLASMNNVPEIAERALLRAAQHWQEKVLPEHFKHGAAGKYGYVQRTVKYVKQNHGKPYLVHSGSMARDLKARAAFTTRKDAIEVRMFARVLNFAPSMPQNDDRLKVSHSRKSGKAGADYPNTKREIKVILDDEREALAVMVVRELEIAFGDTEGRESDD